MLEMKDVVKTFGDFRALDGLTLTVPKGTVYGLVGPNGAGKTTAIRHLTGVFRPDSGTVTMNGAPIDENLAAKERIGFIPDEPFYFPAATMEDMRRFYRGIFHRFDDELYNRMHDIFALPKNSPIRRFSKGMQKQAAFQLTLSSRPEVLILDEVARRSVTVLISSHNLRELEDLCDHVGIMNRGKMLLERSLADMQGSTLKLQIVGEAPENLDVLHKTSSGRLNTYIVRGSMGQVEAAVRRLDPPYFDILPLSLEEIFIYELGGVDYEIKNVLL